MSVFKMSNSDYDYLDSNNNHNNLPTPSHESHYSNLPTAFQAKNNMPIQTPVRVNTTFDYAHIIKENKSRKDKQLSELRLNHARKKDALMSRFNITPNPVSYPRHIL